MRVYSLTELFCMTRNELFALHAKTVASLAAPGLGETEAEDAHQQLRNIRRILTRLALGP